MTIQKEVVRNLGPNSYFPDNTFSLLRTEIMCVYQTYKFFNLDKMVRNMEEEQDLLFLCKRPVKRYYYF